MKLKIEMEVSVDMDIDETVLVIRAGNKGKSAEIIKDINGGEIMGYKLDGRYYKNSKDVIRQVIDTWKAELTSLYFGSIVNTKDKE